MNYIKIPIIFAIAYCVITSYNGLYGMQENSRFIKIIDKRNHDHGITTEVEISFECDSAEEIENFIKLLSNRSLQPTNEYIQKVELEHTYQYNYKLYLPLLDFISKKNQEESSTRLFKDYLVLMGVSLHEDSVCLRYIKRDYCKSVKTKISLKDLELQKIITNISKDGFENPAELHKFFLASSLKNYSIEGIQEHAQALVKRIIHTPLQYKFIPKEHMPSYIDVNNPENNVKNQLAILFTNTDFDCNGIINSKLEDEEKNRLETSSTIFTELLIELSMNKEIDSLPIVEEWLNKGSDPNLQALIKVKCGSQSQVVKGRTPFKVAIDLLCSQSIKCTDPQKIITLFLEKKANSNVVCFDISNKGAVEETPFQAFINALNEKKDLLEEHNRNDLIQLFLQSGADIHVLNQAQCFN